MAHFLNKNSALIPYGLAGKSIEESISRLKFQKPLYVTRPTMPSLSGYIKILEKIWRSRWLTNMAAYHNQLEKKLCEYLGVDHCSLFCNGTLALMIGLKALKLKGEVITTPFTFPATVNVLEWLGLTPVFADIEEDTFNLDPVSVQKLITARTSAILGVHVFGVPCRVDVFQDLGARFGLKIIYDAAHAMGVRYRNKALASFGDLSMISFHATKLFTTLEGGALIFHDEKLKEELYYLKNFGIADEETVLLPGINAKMNEFQAAFGLLHLDCLDREIARRKKIASLYKIHLRDIPGLNLPKEFPDGIHNYGYFPIRVEEKKFGMSRDQLYLCLKSFNVHPRKYFYPLVSTYPFYRKLPSANPDLLPVANRIARQILCLPIFGNMSREFAINVCAILWFIHENCHALMRNL